jgi:hypothetical protein
MDKCRVRGLNWAATIVILCFVDETKRAGNDMYPIVYNL